MEAATSVVGEGRASAGSDCLHRDWAFRGRAKKGLASGRGAQEISVPANVKGVGKRFGG